MGSGWLPQDRAERIGLVVSGGGHLVLLIWALVGGIFFRPEPAPPATTANVSLISSKDYAALAARAPTSAVESKPQPSAPATSAPPPARPAKPAPDTPPAPEPPTPPAPTPEPAPTPPAPDPMVEVTPTDAPATPPKAAPTVAPTPTETPAPDAQVSDQVTEQTTEQPAAKPPVQQPTTATAPADAGQVLQTEANKDNKTVGGAPASSEVPKARPERKPAPSPTPAPDTQTATDTAPATDSAQATDQAVADALASELAGAASDTPAAGTGDAASGPPLTYGELDAMKVSVNKCWNFGAVSTDATRAEITVTVSFSPDGKPTSVDMIDSKGASDAAIKTAFDAARRAILRCGAKGYPLPPEKYETWKQIDMTFSNTKGVR